MKKVKRYYKPGQIITIGKYVCRITRKREGFGSCANCILQNKSDANNLCKSGLYGIKCGNIPYNCYPKIIRILE